ncbi:MAG: class I SAM-dependent methyltransferase [Carboxydocellales bacterium]
MAQYEGLADIYDYLMSSVDYEEWLKYIEEILDRFSIQAEVVVDLACGTGNTTLPFARSGYQVTGVDLAGEMLTKARQKADREGLVVEFLQQDMSELKLPSEVDLFTCYHDGINYITKKEDLYKVFALVSTYLKPGGLFIFDLVNVSKLARTDGSTTFIDQEDLALIWETSYLQGEKIWEINLTCFVRQGELFKKFQETHREKAYTREEVEGMISLCGLKLQAVFHSYTFEPAGEHTYRQFFVVQKEC